MNPLPGERMLSGADFSALACVRPGLPSKPLVVLLPGGGHFGRIFYGHPDCEPDDFLVTHLACDGFSTLALSYPALPEMTITQWAAAIAAMTADHLAESQLPRRIVAVGWSLAGRLARTLSVACRDLGIEIEVFIGLSAAPFIPGFGVLSPSDLQLATSGLLDGSSPGSPIFQSREAQLQMIDDLNGRVVIPRPAYAAFHVTDSPINFRGEAERYKNRRLVPDLAAAIADQGTFDYANYPICATISAASPLDAAHALTDSSAFGMLTAQGIYHRFVKPSLCNTRPTARQWTALRRLMASLHSRLSRSVDGSHFFFVGAHGARATSSYIRELHDESRAILDELETVLGTPGLQASR